jgi:release factor glutamine methyltransferase
MTDADGNDDGESRDNGGRPSLAERRETPDVYQPAEDSHLLATAAREEVGAGERALDVGTGSGYVASALADAGADVVASDLNPVACRQAREEGVAAVRGDLLTPFRDSVFDLVTFNPPYLPTPEHREWDDWMERALSGGEDGRRLVDPFIDDVERVLTAEGRVFLLVSSLTDVDAVAEYAGTRGLTGETVAEEKHPYERLVVLRLVPSQ